MTYGLIGERLTHSFSKTIHGFLGNNEYELKEIPRKGLDAFMRRADFKGINVTIPYKEAVLPYCEPDGAAREIGSVNTVINRSGKLYGCNTDSFGFAEMMKRAGVSFGGKKAVILGSGGTSKTAASVAKRGGAGEVVTVSRGGENNYENIERHADCDILINTTPVGMYPNNGRAPVSLDVFKNLSAVADVIFNPLRSRLLLDAKERGIKTAGGLSMLAAQAALAHGLFFETVTPDVDALIGKVELYFSNIVFIGMPGCGKTTVGKAVAQKLGKEFIDTDGEIEKKTGRKPGDIITEDGEPAFRELEKTVIKEITAARGRVIATGGGSVLLKENRDALAENGIVIFLERALEKLEVTGRPLSADLGALYEKRLPVYEKCCDYKVAADS